MQIDLTKEEMYIIIDALIMRVIRNIEKHTLDKEDVRKRDALIEKIKHTLR